jgi:hypothetical protein
MTTFERELIAQCDALVHVLQPAQVLCISLPDLPQAARRAYRPAPRHAGTQGAPGRPTVD